jgi:hypothetical protein
MVFYKQVAPTELNLQDFEILSPSKLDQVFQEISFEGMQILDFKITINEHMLDDEIEMFTVIDQSVFLSVAENIER